MNLKEAYFSGVEDDKRVFENDRKCDKKGNPMKPFVPIEEVPDTDIDIEGDVDEKIKRIKEEIETDPEEETEIPERKEDVEIGFSEEDGVAHVGPDFEKVGVKNSISSGSAEEGLTAELLKKNYKFKSFNQPKPSIHHGPAIGHDNLKTLKKKESFLGRLFRKKTRDVLENPDTISQEDNSNNVDIMSDYVSKNPDLFEENE